MRRQQTLTGALVIAIGALVAGCGGGDAVGSDTQVTTIVSQDNARDYLRDTRAIDDDLSLLSALDFLSGARSQSAPDGVELAAKDQQTMVSEFVALVAKNVVTKDQSSTPCTRISSDSACTGFRFLDASFVLNGRTDSLPAGSYVSFGYDNFQASDRFGGAKTNYTLRLEFPDGINTSQPYQGKVEFTFTQDQPVPRSYSRSYDLQDFTMLTTSDGGTNAIYNGYLNRPGALGPTIFYSNWSYGVKIPAIGSYMEYVGSSLFSGFFNRDPNSYIRLTVVDTNDTVNYFHFTAQAGANATTAKWGVTETFNTDGTTTITVGRP